MFRNMLLCVALMVVGSGCASFVAQPDRVKAVKRVAIVGFGVEAEPTESLRLTWSPGSSVKAHSGRETTTTVWEQQERPHLNAVYAALARELQAHFRWDAVSIDDLRASGLYQEMAKKQRNTIRYIPMGTAPMDFFNVPGIAAPEKADAFSLDERRQLLQALKADAIAIATVRVYSPKVDRLTIGKVGLGQYEPYAQVTIKMVDGRDDEPIWRDLLITGERVPTKALAVNGLTDLDAFNTSVVSATAKSFSNLTKHYDDETSSKK